MFLIYQSSIFELSSMNLRTLSYHSTQSLVGWKSFNDRKRNRVYINVKKPGCDRRGSVSSESAKFSLKPGDWSLFVDIGQELGEFLWVLTSMTLAMHDHYNVPRSRPKKLGVSGFRRKHPISAREGRVWNREVSFIEGQHRTHSCRCENWDRHFLAISIALSRRDHNLSLTHRTRSKSKV
jgi:hypothetical protein